MPAVATDMDMIQNLSSRKLAWDTANHCFVDAEDAPRDGTYVCLCKEQRPVFLRRGDVRRAHWAHCAEGGAEEEHRCRFSGGGEGLLHLSAKKKLVEMVGQYSFAFMSCPGCGEEMVETCIGGSMEVEKRSDEGDFRYDLIYTRPDGMRIAMEVFASHPSSKIKIERARATLAGFAEFTAQDVLSMKAGDKLKNLHVEVKPCCPLCKNVFESRKQLEAKRKADQYAAYKARQEAELKAHQEREELNRAELKRQFEELEKARQRQKEAKEREKEAKGREKESKEREGAVKQQQNKRKLTEDDIKLREGRLPKQRRFCFCAGNCLCGLSVVEEGMYHEFLHEQQQMLMQAMEYDDLAFLDYYRRKNRGVVLGSEATSRPIARRTVSTAVGRAQKQAEKSRAEAEHAEFVARCRNEPWNEPWFLCAEDMEKKPMASAVKMEAELVMGADGVLLDRQGGAVSVWGNPFILTCGHVSRRFACSKCGTGPTWDSVTRVARLRELAWAGR